AARRAARSVFNDDKMSSFMGKGSTNSVCHLPLWGGPGRSFTSRPTNSVCPIPLAGRVREVVHQSTDKLGVSPPPCGEGWGGRSPVDRQTRCVPSPLWLAWAHIFCTFCEYVAVDDSIEALKTV